MVHTTRVFIPAKGIPNILLRSLARPGSVPKVAVRGPLYKRTRAFADEEEMTVSEVVEDALTDYLVEKEEEAASTAPLESG